VTRGDLSTEGRQRDVTGVLLGLIVLVFAVPSILVFQPLGAGATPAALLGTVLFLWWASTRLLGDDEAVSRVRVRPIHLALLFFAAALLLSNWAGNFHARSALETSSADRAVLIVLAWAGVTLAAADGLLSRRSIDRVLHALVVGAAAMSVVGFLQFFFGFDIARFVSIPGLTPRSDLAFIQERSIFRRVAGTAGHPIEFGVTLAVILPLAVHFVVAPGRDRLHRDVVFLVLIAAAIPMTLSRSATLGMAVAGGILFAGWNGAQRRKALIVVPVFAVALRLFVPGLLGTIRSLFLNLGNDPSIEGRTDDYAYVQEFFVESPVVGQGWGTFIPEEYTTLDNQYLVQAVETGVIGILALLTLFAVGFSCGRGIRLRASDEQTRHLGQALAASIAVVAVTFLTFDGLSFPMVTLTAFLLLGVIGAFWRLTVAEHGMVVQRDRTRRGTHDAMASHTGDLADPA